MNRSKIFPCYLHRGFTLIEHLVIITILLVLAAILFPVFAHIPEKSPRVSCMSNLKQIGMASHLYMQDYDDRMFLTYSDDRLPGGAPRTYQAWWYSYVDLRTGKTLPEKALLYPYMKNNGIKGCPLAPETLSGTADPAPTQGYAFNTTYLCPSCTTPPSAAPALLADITTPAETILMGDGGFLRETDAALGRTGTLNPPFKPAPSTTTTPYPTTHGRHNGMANLLWLDGHVKTMQTTPRPTGWNAVVTRELLEKNKLGDILPGGVQTGNPSKDNYYFLLKK